MVEEVYTALHRDKTRALIYKSLYAREGSMWQEKWDAYETMYKDRLATGRFRVDYTDDNEISKTEGDKVISNIRFSV